MNANFGLVAPLGYKVKGKKKEKNLAYAERALAQVCENSKIMESLWK
jgi:folate-dependent tRNA-U54 methylase TrmFO/GidA